MKLPRYNPKRARIEIVPMIDTIFFLLVFFMITWLSMVKMNGLALAVPRVNHETPHTPPSVVLSVSPAGTYYVGSDRATPDDWEGRLRARLARQPNTVVVLNVAPTQRTQTLVDMMDRVNKVVQSTHGSAQVLIATPRVATGASEAPAPSVASTAGGPSGGALTGTSGEKGAPHAP